MRERLKPALTHPTDFDAFWESTLDELRGVPADVHRRLVEKGGPGEPVLETVRFQSLGGCRVSGYLLSWPDDVPRPLVVHSHGYGCQYEIQWSWARAGLNVAGVDIRGFGRSRDALRQRSRHGYVLTGIDSPESSVLRGAVCDYARLVEVASALLSGRIERTVLHGISFAGGLAMMAQGLLGVGELLAAGVPTFGWAEGRYFFVRSGSGAEINRFLGERPDHIEDVMLVLRYFDTINFADRVTCPTVVALGLEDEVVPAKTVYAIANHLAGPHEIVELPFSHTDGPEEQHWRRFEEHWMGYARGGVPDDFGGRVLPAVHDPAD